VRRSDPGSLAVLLRFTMLSRSGQLAALTEIR
jgi:hypothetical protein